MGRTGVGTQLREGWSNPEEDEKGRDNAPTVERILITCILRVQVKKELPLLLPGYAQTCSLEQGKTQVPWGNQSIYDHV
jgi:hypothetical protein